MANPPNESCLAGPLDVQEAVTALRSEWETSSQQTVSTSQQLQSRIEELENEISDLKALGQSGDASHLTQIKAAHDLAGKAAEGAHSRLDALAEQVIAFPVFELSTRAEGVPISLFSTKTPQLGGL